MPRPNGIPILLQHGFQGDSGNFVYGGPDDGLGFVLYDMGFDVYLGNGRGNTYSRKHQTMSPEEDKFWHWSFQEMASFDFPAMVEQVVVISGAEKIWFIGYSEGAMIAHLVRLCNDKNCYLDVILNMPKESLLKNPLLRSLRLRLLSILLQLF